MHTGSLFKPNSCYLFVLIVLLLLCHEVVFGLIYVNSNAKGNNNGFSWKDAFIDLQAAINKSNAGDTIWVARGVYYPGTGKPSVPAKRNRLKTFLLNKGISLFGGFNGTENKLHERDCNLNPCILSGDIDSNDTNCPALSYKDIKGENAYHVISVQDAREMILDGFVITAGCSDNDESFNGGGLYNTFSKTNSSSPCIRNCKFMGNCARYGGACYDYALGGKNNTAFYNCSFYGNKAYINGGAITCFGEGGESNITLKQCNFKYNTCKISGGALFIDVRNSGKNLSRIHNCSFEQDSAWAGGAIFIDAEILGSSDLVMDSCSFGLNFAREYAGAIYACGNIKLNITNSGFTDNKSDIYVGGIYLGGNQDNISCSIVQCKFMANTSLFGGSIISASGNGKIVLSIDKCIFSGNKSIKGNGPVIRNNDPLKKGKVSLNNCTINDNFSYDGKAIYSLVNKVSVSNSSVDCNNCSDLGDMVTCKGKMEYNKH